MYLEEMQIRLDNCKLLLMCPEMLIIPLFKSLKALKMEDVKSEVPKYRK